MQQTDIDRVTAPKWLWFNHQGFTESRIRWILRVIAISLGAAQAWVARNAINPDGRSHIEIARAYLRHDWHAAINPYWGPLYSWIVAAALGISKPGSRSEFPVVHAVNFVLFVFAIFAFEFFWSELLASSQKSYQPDAHSDATILPGNILWIMGYALFIWLTISLLVPLVNADICVAILVLLDLALLLKITIFPTSNLWVSTFFGLALCAGYLAKAVMFPVGFVFLVLAVISSKTFDKRKSLLLSLLIFLCLSAPQIFLLSRATGHLTFSESGKFPFAWSNYNLPIRNWQGDPSSSGQPLHPTRKVYNHPAVFEFNGPIKASYPPWYDPSYWNAGMSPAFEIKTIAKHFVSNLPEMGAFLLMPRLWLLALLILLLLCQPRATLAGIMRHWYVLGAITIVFVLYLFTFWETRYVPAWGIAFWGVVVVSIRTRNQGKSFTVWLWSAVFLAALSILQIGHGIYGQMRNMRPDDATPEYVTAEGLKKMGVRPGAKVAAIGYDNDAYFAYLDNLSIIAEINTDQTCEFWQSSPPIQSEIFAKFREAGVNIIVANTGGGVRNTTHEIPINVAACSHPGVGWRQIEGSPNHIYFLH